MNDVSLAKGIEQEPETTQDTVYKQHRLPSSRQENSSGVNTESKVAPTSQYMIPAKV